MMSSLRIATLWRRVKRHSFHLYEVTRNTNCRYCFNSLNWILVRWPIHFSCFVYQESRRSWARKLISSRVQSIPTPFPFRTRIKRNNIWREKQTKRQRLRQSRKFNQSNRQRKMWKISNQYVRRWNSITLNRRMKKFKRTINSYISEERLVKKLKKGKITL